MTELARFYRANYKGLLRIIVNKVGDKDVAEELLQDVFVRASVRPFSPMRGATMFTWIYAIIKRVVIDHYRRRAIRQAHGEPILRLEDLRDTASYSPEYIYMTTADVRAALSSLPPTLQAVARMAFIEEMSTNDIAIIMNVERHTVQIWKAKASTLLKTHLEGYR